MSQRVIRVGVSLSPESTSWPDTREVALRIDALGYDYLFTWDHLLGAFGARDRPVFEGWTLISALAALTTHVRLGLLVGAVGFRRTALVASAALTLDHVSGGRALVGLGAGWAEEEHVAFGLPFPSLGARLTELDAAAGEIRTLLDHDAVGNQGGSRGLLELRPIQPRIPILIGGWGPRRTPELVARRADIWNAKGSPEDLVSLDRTLRERCAALGRDQAEIERSIACRMVIRDTVADARAAWERICGSNGASPDIEADPWLGPPEVIADRFARYAAIGFRTLVASLPTPYDLETIERLAKEVRPLVH